MRLVNDRLARENQTVYEPWVATRAPGNEWLTELVRTSAYIASSTKKNKFIEKWQNKENFLGFLGQTAGR